MLLTIESLGTFGFYSPDIAMLLQNSYGSLAIGLIAFRLSHTLLGRTHACVCYRCTPMELLSAIDMVGISLKDFIFSRHQP